MTYDEASALVAKLANVIEAKGAESTAKLPGELSQNETLMYTQSFAYGYLKSLIAHLLTNTNEEVVETIAKTIDIHINS